MDTERKIFIELRKAVSTKLGKEISSSSHCDELSIELKKIGFIINAQTFRRFFGLIKSSGKFHLFTLDALSQYCEFPDFSSFKKNLIENDLDIFFGDLDGKHPEFNYWALSENICRKIIDSPSMLASVHHQLVKYPLARTFFIEHHPMRDLAGTVYAQYFQYYLKYEHANEAKLFAYGFLYMSAFLTENQEFREIYSKKINETELTSEVYVLPAARKFGVPLLQSWLKKDDVEFTAIYNQMLTARESYKASSEKSVCSFEYAIMEHLIFTDKTDEMLFLIENNTFQIENDRVFVPQDRKENHEICWNIMCSVAYLKMGRDAECKKYLAQVCLEKLSLGWKKFYSILYYFTKYEVVSVDQKPVIKDQLRQLIEETHLLYFSDQLNLLLRKDTDNREQRAIS